MEIVKNSDGVFYYKDEEHKGKKFRIFNYRLASYSDFEKDLKSLELRGLTFCLDTNEMFWGLHKFFNDKENPFTMEEWKNKELEVVEKLDGSLIQAFFVGDELFVKTKSTFKSEQAQEAEKFIKENKRYFDFIKACMDKGLYPLFEYVSPFNQIVVEYPETDLRIIQIRDKEGNYLPYKDLKSLAENFGISYAKKYNYTFEQLKELQEKEVGLEGWVVRNFEEPLHKQFRKFKTNWYFSLHHLISPDNFVENKLIEHILNETIDDIISQLGEGEKRRRIENIREKVSHYFDKTLEELKELLKEKNNSDRKEFALKYKEHPYFGVIMASKTEEDLVCNLKEAIKKRTNKLSKAREFLENIGA